MDVMSSCTSFRRESTLFTIFERNDNCIFLSIIPPLKLMVFSCCQTICLQQRLNELYSVNHHSALSIGQQPVWNLKGHGKFSGARSNRNRLPIFPLQNADIGRTPKNTDNICIERNQKPLAPEITLAVTHHDRQKQVEVKRSSRVNPHEIRLFSGCPYAVVK